MTDSDPVLENRGPYKVVGKSIAYENPWIRVVEESVIRPDGSKGMFGVIEVGKGRGGVAILPVDSEMNVLLVREFMYASNRYDVEVCGGGVDEGEEPLSAAKRELKEEFGITAANWVDFGRIGHATTLMRGGAQLYLAQGFLRSDVSPEAGIEVVTYPLVEAVDLVMQGRIFASTTCCLLLMAARHFDL